MEIVLNRIAKLPTYTIGHLYMVSTDLIKWALKKQGETDESIAKLLTQKDEKRGIVPPLIEHLTEPSLASLLNASTFFCDTLEPTWRDIGWGHKDRKIAGKTAIPEGRYPVVITYSPRFKRWLPLLVSVPMFSGIRIHSGNTPQDTEGCILVGLNLKKGQVLESRKHLQQLIYRLQDCYATGEAVWITVR